jgi:tetratricopeptide (TPR) repeat protein
MLLGNRYQVEETLGRGGAGVVYRAFDLKLQRPVAVKALNTSPAGPDQGVERLRREAALLSRLAHPNIVGCYDLGEEAGQPYLVLEYVAGCTLRDLLEAHDAPFPLETANHIIGEVLAALSVAHQAGVIHRDLKPENIMLAGVEPEDAFDLDLATLRPQVKVMDFGLAYLSGDGRITSENLVAGTALYLAPEAALGQTADARADLYAVGLIWYELVAGRFPFRGHEPLVVISQHLHGTPISPRWHNADVPPALASLILKLLAKTPADRYQTAAAVLTDLENVQYSRGADQPLTHASLLEAIARGRLVGREEEIALLRDAIETMSHGTGGVVFIEGEPGIGKTRLTCEAGLYARLKGAQVYTGHCYDADLTLPYQPFIEIVKDYVQTNIQPGSTGHLPVSLAAELVKLAPGLEAHLGVAPASAEISPAEARLRLFEAVTTLFTGGTDPLLLILENLHWASPPDLSLLHHLAQTGLRQRRLLLIITYQGSQPPAGQTQALARLLAQLTRAGLATHLRLSPLSAEGTTALLETLLEGEVTPDFSRAIFVATEGNPFFVEEILKTLVEEDRIFRDLARGRWAGINLDRLEIPASLKDVMGQRFAKLSRPHRQLLGLAALLGRQFRVDALSACAGVGEDEVSKALEKGVKMQLIRRVQPAGGGSDSEVYAFEHALIRQTLAESLSARKRLRLHRQIAQTLEKLNQSRSQPVAPPDELAYHFGLAGDDTEKAISYNLIAADNALRVHASEVAVKHYQFILELLAADKDVARRAWVLEQLGDLYFHHTRQIVDAVAAYEGAIQLWQAAPEADTATRIRLYLNMGEIARYWPGRVEKLDTYLAEALSLLDRDPPQAESFKRARLLAAMAFNLQQSAAQPDDEVALHLAQTAAGLSAKLTAADEEAMALDALQRIYRSRGDLAAAHEIDRRRLALIPRLMDATEAVEANLATSQMGWETGDLAAATRFCLEALATARRTDNIGGQWEALRRLVMLHLQWGKLATAITYATQGVTLGPRAGLLEFGEPVEALFRSHLALLYSLQGQAEAAAHELAELNTLYPTPEAPPYRFALGWLHYEVEAWDEAMLNLDSGQAFPTPFLPGRFDRLLLFEVYGHLGDEFALAELGPEIEAEARRWHLPYLLAILNRGYGAFYTEQGDWTEAETALKRALAVTRGKTLWYQDARTWLDYGRMLVRRNQPGDAEMARDFLSEAQSMFVTFGAHALAEKAWVEVIRLGEK